MSWEHDLAKMITDQGRTGGGASGYLRGDVISPKWDEDAEDWTDGELIISTLGGSVMLTEGMVDRLGTCGKLHDGMTVILLPGERALRGGQRFFVLEVPGHGDTAGREAPDSHPIPAITGLRGELDDHDGRLEDLEDVRVPALEHDMNDGDGKVPLLTGRVSALETGKADRVHTHAMGEVTGLAALADQVAGIAARGGEPNVIETVKRNGTPLVPDANKAVDIAVPEKVSDLTNDSGYQTAGQVQTAVNAGLASLLTATVYGPSALVSFDAGAGGLPVRAVRVAAGTGVSSAAVYLTGKNLFDKAHAKNEYIGADGSVTEASNARCSGYIPISGVCTCSVQRIGTGTDNLLRVALYDANKTFLSRKLSGSASAGNYNTVTIDGSTASYIRVGIFTGSQDVNTMQVELGSSRTAYEAFGGAWSCDPGTGALTPPVMTARAGVNHVWSDEGDVTVEYGAFLLAIQAEIEALTSS